MHAMHGCQLNSCTPSHQRFWRMFQECRSDEQVAHDGQGLALSHDICNGTPHHEAGVRLALETARRKSHCCTLNTTMDVAQSL